MRRKVLALVVASQALMAVLVLAMALTEQFPEGYFAGIVAAVLLCVVVDVFLARKLTEDEDADLVAERARVLEEQLVVQQDYQASLEREADEAQAVMAAMEDELRRLDERLCADAAVDSGDGGNGTFEGPPLDGGNGSASSCGTSAASVGCDSADDANAASGGSDSSDGLNAAPCGFVSGGGVAPDGALSGESGGAASDGSASGAAAGAADASLDEVHRLARALSSSRVCEHAGVDALLAAKRQVCEREGIRATFHVDVPQFITLPGPDLCAAFSNVVDNAINACADVAPDERWIEVRARVAGGYLVLKCLNSWNEAKGAQRAPKRFGASARRRTSHAADAAEAAAAAPASAFSGRSATAELPSRTESPWREHGWGLIILESLAACHEGSLTYGSSDSTWETSLTLKLPPQTH